MVERCANPGCTQRFLYLRVGQLYRFHPAPAQEGEHPPLYFWLCGDCAQQWTLRFHGPDGVTLELRHRALPERGARETSSAVSL
jgi:hypothetical protein